MKIRFNFETSSWEGITVTQVKLWESLYPHADVVHEIKFEMIRWLDKVRDTKKAHKKDWKKFIVNWLKRAEVRGVGL